MVLVSYSGREINAKLVYYGPGLSGKTTNLEYIYGSIPQGQRGKMVSMKTKTERTLFFDFLPVNLGELAGFKTRFLLYTVPGQVYYNATRKLVLKGVDAVVFVADSKRGKMNENIESLQNLKENLEEHGLSISTIPWVMQYNKRDLGEVYSLDELEQVLNPGHVPSFEAVATSGQGVVDTFKAVSRLLLGKLSREIGVSIVSSSPAPAADATTHAAAPVETTPAIPSAAPTKFEAGPGVLGAATSRAGALWGISAASEADAAAPTPPNFETVAYPLRHASERAGDVVGEPVLDGERREGFDDSDPNGKTSSVGERLKRWLTRPIDLPTFGETKPRDEQDGRPDPADPSLRAESGPVAGTSSRPEAPVQGDASVPSTGLRLEDSDIPEIAGETAPSALAFGPGSAVPREPEAGWTESGRADGAVTFSTDTASPSGPGGSDVPSRADSAPTSSPAEHTLRAERSAPAAHVSTPLSTPTPPSSSTNSAEARATRGGTEPLPFPTQDRGRGAGSAFLPPSRGGSPSRRAIKPREVIVPLTLEPEDLEHGVVLRLAIQVNRSTDEDEDLNRDVA
jgi:mutual gliding-motility protein MglA